ncbi:MAG: hypothetical protein IPM07_05410 [Anaerolineales bacterium]|nr:hypothetical protein [Anaerolineales bacterium]
MKKPIRLLTALLLLGLVLTPATLALAQDGDIAPAPIVNDEGGRLPSQARWTTATRSSPWAWPNR